MSDQLLHGIDVSRWQGRIDWPVAATSDLCRFAYIKATEGTGGTDAMFAENWAGTLFAEIPRGAYHFMTARGSGELQAEHFLEVYPGDGELPPVLDLEWGIRGDMPTAEAAEEWLEVVRKETGVQPVVYVSPGFAAQRLAGPVGLRIAAGHDLWVAHYGVKSPTVPRGWSDWRIWQTGLGSVPGIKCKVDVDVMKLRT